MITRNIRNGKGIDGDAREASKLKGKQPKGIKAGKVVVKLKKRSKSKANSIASVSETQSNQKGNKRSRTSDCQPSLSPPFKKARTVLLPEPDLPSIRRQSTYQPPLDESPSHTIDVSQDPQPSDQETPASTRLAKPRKARSNFYAQLLESLSIQSIDAFVTSIGSQMNRSTTIGATYEPYATAIEIATLFRTNDIRKIWTLQRNLEASVSAQSVALVFHRAHVLQICCASWVWLAENVRKAYMARKDGTSHWLKLLADKVVHIMTSGVADTVDAAHYLPMFETGTHTFKVKPSAQIQCRSDTEENFTDLMRPILSLWFSFPSSPSDIARGALVQAVVKRFGVGGLYVPGVWHAYDHIAATVDPVSRRPSRKMTTAWQVNLENDFREPAFDEVVVRLAHLTDAICSYMYGEPLRPVLDVVTDSIRSIDESDEIYRAEYDDSCSRRTIGEYLPA